uniref:Helicase ATP-binding domain-containing protein n=1 Tax=Rhabditophanes sp. KR3021 TaxID=114890 RepID=A0AC35TM19_9BILA
MSSKKEGKGESSKDKPDIKSIYSYQGNSNLVIKSDHGGSDRRRGDGGKDEATGEVMSIPKDHLLHQPMGSRMTHGEAPKVNQAKDGKKKGSRSVVGQNQNGCYAPKSRETKHAYGMLISILMECLGEGFGEDVYQAAADEVLQLVKGQDTHEREKKAGVDALLRPISNEVFNNILNLSKQLNDFVVGSGEDMETEDRDEEAVNVNLDDSEDENVEEDPYRHSDRESSDSEEEGEEADDQRILVGGDDVEMEEGDGNKVLRCIDIDAYWIQRQIEVFYPDKEDAQDKRKKVIEIMKEANNARELERELINLLDTSSWELIKVLCRDHALILYATLWKGADDTEKMRLVEEMSASAELKVILDELEGRSEANLEGTSKRKKAATEDAKTKGQTSRKVLNLGELAFAEGGHFMSSKEVKLPGGSERISTKEYDQVLIPAPPQQQLNKGEKLVKVEALPSWSQKAFEGFTALNRIQSRVKDKALLCDEPLLICAPTGAGKTNIALMCILREMSKHMNEDGSVRGNEFKCIYIAPMKSLVQEMVGSFSKRLKDYGVLVGEMTGDSNMSKEQFMATQVIVCTPEKYDVVTRKGEDRSYGRLVKLVIIDEIHLLHDDRGPVLEAVVMRTLRQMEASKENVRLVGLSATLPNYGDVAAFLKVKEPFFFDNSYRPVPLAQEYIGIKAKNGFKKYQIESDLLYEKVLNEAGKNQVLIFVHSRKETVRTAKVLRDMFIEKGTLSKLVQDATTSSEILRSEANDSNLADLKDLLPYGFGVHHAGMSKMDRTTVEDVFADKHLKVLVSTATLAWGVNLPAHTVIIKGTQVYNPEKGGFTQLSSMDVMQMMGRAGRPQYDSSGLGIMITTNSELQYYLSLLNQQLPVESQMISKLPELLNAEIVLGTVTNMAEAVDWLGYSYLFIRMMQSPSTYGIDGDEFENDPDLMDRRANLIHSACLQLEKGNLIQYDRKSEIIRKTNLGRIASHYYCTFASIQTYTQLLKPTVGMGELFRIFSLSSEFKNIVIRDAEKMELQKLSEKTPIPIKESLEDPSSKVNILLQVYISQLNLSGFAIISDMIYISQSANRLFRALFEIVCARGWADVARKVLNCYKMVVQRQWVSLNPLYQFKKLPTQSIAVIDKRQYAFSRLYDLDTFQLGDLVRQPKLGNVLYKSIRKIPKLLISTRLQPITRSSLRFEVIITPDFTWDDTVHGSAQGFWIFIEDVNGEDILHHEFFLLKAKYWQDEHIVKMIIPVHDPIPPLCYVRVVSDQWFGSETVLPVSFKQLILPDKSAPPTELYDLQPQVVSAVNDVRFEEVLAAKGVTTFNPIQTQCFRPAFETNESLLIGAPYGSGKGVLGELAIFRHINSEDPGKILVICPVDVLATKTYQDYKARLEPVLGLKCGLLTGETTRDQKICQVSNLIISNGEHWDNISRKWKGRKSVQSVKVVIVNDLHQIVEEHGPTLEFILSRMRFMSSQLKSNIRFVALCTSVLNARDLESWLGVKASNSFNFALSARPVTLDMEIQSFAIPHTPSRIDAMARPVYSHIVNHAGSICGKSVIVFVPTRKQAVPIAMDIITSAFNDTKIENKFLHIDANDQTFREVLETVKDPTLKATLGSGVGYLHEGVCDSDRDIVERLFNNDAIQIVVVSRNLCYDVNIASYLVIIMDTVYYNGYVHTYEDYPSSELLYMIGLANLPSKFAGAKCVLMCQDARKSYYKKILTEMLPIESHLDQALEDHLNAEIVQKTIENKQDAVEFLTWTFLYRRLPKNPNYYNLKGVTDTHICDFLSDLIENTCNYLIQAKCIESSDEFGLEPLNLGIIAGYYYISFTTIEIFGASIKERTKVRGLLEIIGNANEFSDIIIRHHETKILSQLAEKLSNQLRSQKFSDPRVKTNLLLNSYLSRFNLSAELNKDIKQIVPTALRLVHGIVDVLSSNAWLHPALAAMTLSQMLTQAMYNNQSYLTQVPHCSGEMLERGKKMEVNNINDLLMMEDEDRLQLLQMTDAQLVDVVKFCNNYPDIEVQHEVEKSVVEGGGEVTLSISLTRENDVNGLAPPVVAPFYPATKKDEGWWVVIGEPSANAIHYIKKITFNKHYAGHISFEAPTEGIHQMKMYLICDSYLGADQEFPFEITVGGKEEQMEE